MSFIYTMIERWQHPQKWGRFLDAGTGDQSLSWALGLDTESLTAITGSQSYADELAGQHVLREQDRLLADNWTNHSLLQGEQFDTVMADYLLGAVDGFSPYFQNALIPRLRPHLKPGGTFYFIGLEPFPDYSENQGDQLLIRMAKLRDACILHAGHRCYREYPLEWVQTELVRHGFEIVKTKPFFSQYGMSFVTSQLGVARSKMDFIDDKHLKEALVGSIQSLEDSLSTYIDTHGPISLGFDYLIQAKLKEEV